MKKKSVHMPMPILILMLIPLLSAAAASEAASGVGEGADAGWIVRRDRDGIQIALRSVTGSRYQEVRGRMQLNASPAEVVGLLQDTNACKEWIAYCGSARIVEQVSAAEMVTYSWNDMPWPVGDRDVVARVRITLDSNTGAIRRVAQAEPDGVPVHPDRIRLRHATSIWTVTPNATGCAVELRSHVDPASPLPAWLSNRLLVDAPFGTLGNLRTLVQTGRYSEATLRFPD